MEGWPQQASDRELRDAEELAAKLTGQGLIVLTDAALSTAADRYGIEPFNLRTVFDACGYHEWKYEGTGETVVADVTQVCGEMWVHPWVREAVLAVPVDRMRTIPADARYTGRDMYNAQQADVQRSKDHIRGENLKIVQSYLRTWLPLLTEADTRAAVMATLHVGGHCAMQLALIELSCDPTNWHLFGPAREC